MRYPLRLVTSSLSVVELLDGSGTGFLRSRSSALSLSTCAGIGIEPELSCGDDVGVAVSSMKRKP